MQAAVIGQRIQQDSDVCPHARADTVQHAGDQAEEEYYAKGEFTCFSLCHSISRFLQTGSECGAAAPAARRAARIFFCPDISSIVNLRKM